MNTEQREIEKLWTEISENLDEQFPATASEYGIARFEKLLGITPNPKTESLEFRRERIPGRAGMRPPFTEEFLRRMLNRLIGEGKYILEIDYANYTFYVESGAENQQWYSEVRISINTVKPCNMVFVNKPLAASRINLSAEIGYGEKTYNYRLGTRWRLGIKPFAESEYKGVVKMPEVMSVQSGLLENMAAFAAEDIKKAVLNDTAEITEFITKTAAGEDVIIEYEATPELAAEITNIKLYDGGGRLLDESVLYIPVDEAAVIKHIIRIREGV